MTHRAGLPTVGKALATLQAIAALHGFTCTCTAIGSIVPPRYGGGWIFDSVEGEAALKIIRANAEFPMELVHPAIAETSWLLLARGELSLAVFNAFKHLEVMVRETCKFTEADYGLPMIEKAFHWEKGPLQNLAQGDSERQALAKLMAGAFGCYKNPHSHRIGEIRDVREAQEMILLATHLMRIVEARRPT